MCRMLTQKFVDKLHEMKLEDALAQVATVATAMMEDPAVMVAQYREMRVQREIPAMVKRVEGVLTTLDSDLATLMVRGWTPRLVLTTEGVELKMEPKVHPALAGRANAVPTQAKAEYHYFDNNGQIRVAEWLKTKHPGSPATKRLLEMEAANRLYREDEKKGVPKAERRGSASKEGAPDICRKYDPELWSTVTVTRIG